jgi:carbon monoxide dehydrogenase subunit G
MKIEKSFEVHSPVEAVWDLLQDIPTVAQCLPGAELTGSPGPNHHKGTVMVAIGPMSAMFEGEAHITPEPAEHRGVIKGSGTDSRGGNQAALTMEYRLTSIGERTTSVAIDVDVELSGPVAKFGRTGLMEEIADRLIGDFSACLDAKLVAATPEEAEAVVAKKISGISLFFSSLGSWLARLLRKLFRRE